MVKKLLLLELKNLIYNNEKTQFREMRKKEIKKFKINRQNNYKSVPLI